jgi:hypothetical protein
LRLTATTNNNPTTYTQRTSTHTQQNATKKTNRRRFSDPSACPYPSSKPADGTPWPSYTWWPDWSTCEPRDWSGQRWLSRAPPAKMAELGASFQLPRDGAAAAALFMFVFEGRGGIDLLPQ